MNYLGKPWRTIWPEQHLAEIGVIDQRLLPHEFKTLTLRSADECAEAIRNMTVRGAPLIGATAAYGLSLSLAKDPSDLALASAYDMLLQTRPTAVNLKWALDQLRAAVAPLPAKERAEAAWEKSAQLCDDDAATNEAIGTHGLKLFQEIWDKKRAAAGTEKPVLNVLTHCNAGWIACVDWGTALAPIYKAHDLGIPVHVWVDETRPRNQGASLTAWELKHHGVPYTVIVDNCGGHLMQHGMIDLCIVGTDRTTARGDVCNKIGTYLKALAAKDNDVPFFVALPSSTIDWTIDDALKEIPIEQRSPLEVTHIRGKTASGEMLEVQLTPDGSKAANYGFDVTPARLVTALITERGSCKATITGLKGLFSEER